MVSSKGMSKVGNTYRSYECTAIEDPVCADEYGRDAEDYNDVVCRRDCKWLMYHFGRRA